MLPATNSEELNPDLTVLHLPPFTVQRCVDTSCPWECRPLYLRPRCCPHFPTPQMFCLPRNSTTSSVSHKQRLSSKNHRFPNPSGGGFGGGVDADRLWITLVNLGVGRRWRSFKKKKKTFPMRRKAGWETDEIQESDIWTIQLLTTRHCQLLSNANLYVFFPLFHHPIISCLVHCWPFSPPPSLIPCSYCLHALIDVPFLFTHSFHSGSVTWGRPHQNIMTYWKMSK